MIKKIRYNFFKCFEDFRKFIILLGLCITIEEIKEFISYVPKQKFPDSKCFLVKF